MLVACEQITWDILQMAQNLATFDASCFSIMKGVDSLPTGSVILQDSDQDTTIQLYVVMNKWMRLGRDIVQHIVIMSWDTIGELTKEISKQQGIQ